MPIYPHTATANKLPLAVGHFVYSYIWRCTSPSNGVSIGNSRQVLVRIHMLSIKVLMGELPGYLAAGITNNIL